MGKIVRLGLAHTATAALCVLWTAPVGAQTPDGNASEATQSDESTAAGAASSNRGGDIVVTAQKREQRLQDVPISIAAVSGSTLDKFHANDFRQVQKFIPNVFVETTAGNDVIYIRGFGSPPANFSFDQSVSMYIDGIYAGKSRQSQAPFFDLERVEVLRGPQGALFGKNTAAGAVSVISAKPTKTLQGEITAAYNFDLLGYDIWGFVSGPLTDTLSVRLAAKFLDQDGYITNLHNGRSEPQNKDQLARLTVKWEPTEIFDITGIVDYGNHDVIGGMNVSSSLTGPQEPRQTRHIDSYPLGDEGTTAQSWMLSATANLRLGEYTITSITGWSQFDANIVNYFDQTIPTGGIAGNSVYNSFPETFDQFSQELRLLSPAGKRLEYILGLYYDSSNYHLTQLGGFNIPAFNYLGLEQTDFDQNASSFSAFGQATFKFTDAFRAIASLRYSEVSKDATFTGKMIYGPYPLRPLTNAVGSLNESNVDPSIVLQYDFSPDVMAYATYGQGSKSGGFVSNTYGTTDSTFPYLPESSQNIEAGVKSTLLGGKLIANASIYSTKFTDLQVSVYNPNTSSYVTGNAASATSTGIEGQLLWYPTQTLDFNLSFAYTDANYDDYPGATCLASQPPTCRPATNNLAGYPLPYTSRWSGNFQAHYRLYIADNLKFDTTAMVFGRSEFFNSDDQSPYYGLQPAYAKLDLRFQLAPLNDRWHVALLAQNVTNELTTGSAFRLPAPITTAPRAIMYVQTGSNVSVEAGFRF